MSKDSKHLEHLMVLSREGDRTAFAELCELRRKRLSAEVQRKMDPRLMARIDPSDVIQEVFLDANQRLSEMQGADIPLIAWLRFLCNQKLVDLQRKHIGAKKRSVQRESRQQAADFSLDSIAELLVANLTSPSLRVHRRDLAERVRVLLKELSPLDREILVLRHFEELSNQEVADSLRLSCNAASNRYVRALRRFRSVLESARIELADSDE